MAKMDLTAKQVTFLQNLTKDDFWESGLDSVIWVDIYCDTLEGAGIMGRMTAGAMVTTLREKGVIWVGHKTEKKSSPAFFELTELGKSLMRKMGVQ